MMIPINTFLRRIWATPCSKHGCEYDVPVTSRTDLDNAAGSQPTIRLNPNNGGYALAYRLADGLVVLMGRGSCAGVIDARAYIGRPRLDRHHAA